MSENDQPHSSQWESYKLINLDGENIYYVEGIANWEEVFNNLKPVCPNCKRPLTISDIGNH